MATLHTSQERWTVQEYLSTSWHTDREFVDGRIDGRIEERNLGEKEHSILQRYLTVLFYMKRAEWGVEVFPELRTQVASTNFRVLRGKGGNRFHSFHRSIDETGNSSAWGNMRYRA